MKISCKVIKEDLLPLYMDNTISSDGKTIVESHLENCEDCKSYYSKIKNDEDIKNDEKFNTLAYKIKRKRLLTVSIVGIIFLLLFIGIVYSNLPKYSKNLIWVREYVIGEEGIKGSVDKNRFGNNKAYEIGANKYGYAVFKNPDQAFKQMKKDHKKGLSAISKEFKLFTINRFNFYSYMNLGWQLTGNYDEETLASARMVSSILDIYKSSFSESTIFTTFYK